MSSIYSTCFLLFFQNPPLQTPEQSLSVLRASMRKKILRVHMQLSNCLGRCNMLLNACLDLLVFKLINK